MNDYTSYPGLGQSIYPFLVNRWHITPSYCSHSKKKKCLFLPWQFLKTPFFLMGWSVSLLQSGRLTLYPQICRFYSFFTRSIRLLKLGLISYSQAGNGYLCLHGVKTSVIEIPLSARGWLGGSQTEGIRHVDLKCYYIIHIILILEHSSLCIHNFRPLISQAVKEKYFSSRE